MNTSTSSSTSGSTSGSTGSAQRSSNLREGDDNRRPVREATPQQADAFAKLLRHKQRDPDADAQASLSAGLFLRPDLPQPVTASLNPADVQATSPTATADALRCAQVHGAAPAAALAGAAAVPSSWEVRLGDPLSGGLQLHATASAATAVALTPAAPTWELSLASSQIGAQTLARHAPRLSERLRERGVDHNELQVQGSRQRRTPPDEMGDERD